jgi:hypothetical protein
VKTALIFAVVLFYPLGVCAVHTNSEGQDRHTKHYEQSLFKMTEKELFSVEMVIKEKELKVGVNTFDLIVHDRNDKDVVGAAITVTPWMPEMGHGVFEKPVVRERGGGLYSVENIILIMGGRWDLRMTIKAEAAEDTVTFAFPDVRTDEAMSQDMHKTTYSSAPADVDTSAVRISSKKLFKVSYKSESMPISVGRIFTLRLRVETMDGKPLQGAEIAVNGSMPEHGHGLPTRPEVSKGVTDGDYIVQGLKFSMPGWWMITFHVNAKDMDDSVTFNLIVQ